MKNHINQKKTKNFSKLLLLAFALVFTLNACNQAAKVEEVKEVERSGAFYSDESFLKEHTDILVLKNGASAVALAPAYQGRVMTSTYDYTAGPSFGWINRPVVAKGFLSDEEKKGTLEEHIYIFGGEERFWFGPEGGQYALFFKPGAKFDFSDWQTPAAIDTEPFELVKQSESSASFTHKTSLVNFSGAKFDVGVERTITVLDKAQVENIIHSSLSDKLNFVGYESSNKITNIGSEAWKPETGLISIWLLGMYNPAAKTVVVVPFKEGSEEELGPKVNDEYFGKVPADYLKVENNALYFKGDGTHRGKIGLTAKRSKGIMASYDPAGQVLTLLTYNVQEAINGYVNSTWEMQKEPYGGDVINSYNDGPPTPGADPLGPFYELETSSPAAALAPNESMTHVQNTIHIQGNVEELSQLTQQLLGVSIEEINSKF